MGFRYEFETPGFFKCAFLLLSDRLTGANTPLEWILNKQTGQRFAIDRTESALLSTLGLHLSHYDALPKHARDALNNHAFDAVATAFAERRAGDCSRYDALLEWDEKDWKNWCAENLRIANND